MRRLLEKKNIGMFYEIFIASLALFAVIISFLDLVGKITIDDSIILFYLDLAILIIFAIDYFIRLIIAENKKEFFKNNIFDLIAIIPFNSLFRIFRVLRLARTIKILRIVRFNYGGVL